MRVLVVDDDIVSLHGVRDMLRSFGYDCDLASDGQQAWTAFDQEPYDVVIVDREMPRMSGLELTRQLREHPSGRRAYVLLLTVGDEQGDAIEGVSAGADDYIVKPLTPQALQMRLISAARVAALHQQIEQMTTKLELAALTDPLTGLGNRVSMNDDLDQLAGMVRRYNHTYCLALADVDHFKSFNDTYGHQAGDRALAAVAGALAGTGRKGDRAYRYGGEEFVLVLPEQSGQRAVIALERVRDRVCELALPHAANQTGFVTVSIGAAVLTSDGEVNPEHALAAADRALYSAKSLGRNRVVTSW